MRKLLSPLADPIFKRIFGEEKDILISLINAIIELDDPVIEIKYLQPVHCICIINANIDVEDEVFIQTYGITRRRNRLSELEGMQFHFIELPKFRKMSKFDLTNPLQGWMKFFTDPEYFSTMPIRHYETFEELKKAIELVDESNFTPEQLYAYDCYLDNIRTKKAIEDYIKETSFDAGMEKGIQLTITIIKILQEGNLTHEAIAEQFGISVEEVEKMAAAFK